MPSQPAPDVDLPVAVLTGGSGVLMSAIAEGLARAGYRVALLNRTREKAEAVAARIRAAGGAVEVVPANVTDRASLESAAQELLAKCGRIDVLVNGAGGNRVEATTAPDRAFFDLDPAALRAVIDLNLAGTILASQAFGRHMAARKAGVIVNISSVSAERPLSRVVGYGAAKAAIENFTRWLAVHLARECGPGLRVNALVPGFFETEQNRALLREPSGELTPRGKRILERTPMGRFGEPSELFGALLWLVSPAASFVTGAIIPVDGGFLADSGV